MPGLSMGGATKPVVEGKTNRRGGISIPPLRRKCSWGESRLAVEERIGHRQAALDSLLGLAVLHTGSGPRREFHSVLTQDSTHAPAGRHPPDRGRVILIEARRHLGAVLPAQQAAVAKV